MKTRLAALILSILTISPLRASVFLDNAPIGTAGDLITYGDVAAIGGQSSLSVAITVHLSATLEIGRFVNKWGSTTASQSFVFYATNTDEIEFVLNLDSVNAGVYYGCQTTDGPMSGGALLRVLAKATVGSGCDIYVNGTQRSTSLIYNNAGTLVDTTTAVRVGNETADAAQGSYGEFVIWSEEVPDWVAEAYGKGYGANIYRTNGILYAPMIRTTMLRDVWGGVAGSASSVSGTQPGTHFPMMYPYGM